MTAVTDPRVEAREGHGRSFSNRRPNPEPGTRNPELGTGNPERGTSIERRQAIAGYLFIAPAMVIFLVFTILPVVYTLYLSFTDYSLTRLDWVGLENYQLIFEDLFVEDNSVYKQALFNTLTYAGFSIPLSMGIGLALALLMNQKLHGLGLYRTVYYVPVVTSMVAVAMIWIQLFDPLYGVISNALESIGIRGINWLGDPNLAMPSIIAVSVWKVIGWNMLIYLAGLQGIPNYLREAAAIDGATRWQSFWNITLPLLQPTTFFIFVTSLIGAFQVFDQVYVMTGGGPANATTTLVHQIYNAAFKALELGYAAAESFVLFGIILLVSLLAIRAVQSEVAYQ